MFNLMSAASYIDPTTTNYVIQILVGVAVAVSAVIGIFGNKLKRLLFKKKSGDETPAAELAGSKNEKRISALPICSPMIPMKQKTDSRPPNLPYRIKSPCIRYAGTLCFVTGICAIMSVL